MAKIMNMNASSLEKAALRSMSSGRSWAMGVEVWVSPGRAETLEGNSISQDMFKQGTFR